MGSKIHQRQITGLQLGLLMILHRMTTNISNTNSAKLDLKQKLTVDSRYKINGWL